MFDFECNILIEYTKPYNFYVILSEQKLTACNKIDLASRNESAIKTFFCN